MSLSPGPPMRTLVVGLGLIGGSIAQRLAAVGDLVIGWDSHDETRHRARAAGLDVPTDLPANLSGVDLVVLAVPLRAMPATLARLADAWTPPGPLLIDVGSVKGPVRRLVRRHGLAHRYVGTHPMAGSENSGFAAARGELLLAAPWAITIDPDTELSDVLAIMHWVMSRHDGRVIPLDDDSHDRAVALVSHLPHALANILLAEAGNSPQRDLAVRLAAGSFRDGTRVAGTNPARTEAMLVENHRWVAPLIAEAADRLAQMAATLAAGGSELPVLTDAALAREHLDRRTTEQGTLALTDDPGRVLDRLLRIGRAGGQFTSVDVTSGVARYRV